MKIPWRARLKTLGQLLVLTSKEKQVLIFIMAALVLGVIVKHYREKHPIMTAPAKPEPKSQAPARTTRHGPHRNVPPPPAPGDKADD